jgi:hypothetical protein
MVLLVELSLLVGQRRIKQLSIDDMPCVPILLVAHAPQN